MSAAKLQLKMDSLTVLETKRLHGWHEICLKVFKMEFWFDQRNMWNIEKGWDSMSFVNIHMQIYCAFHVYVYGVGFVWMQQSRADPI